MKKSLAKRQGDGNVAVAERTRNATTYTPRFDIVETGDELVLVGDLPGLKKEALDVRFENGELTDRRQRAVATHRARVRLRGIWHRRFPSQLYHQRDDRRRENLRRIEQRRVDAAPAESRGGEAAQDYGEGGQLIQTGRRLGGRLAGVRDRVARPAACLRYQGNGELEEQRRYDNG